LAIETKTAPINVNIYIKIALKRKNMYEENKIYNLAGI